MVLKYLTLKRLAKMKGNTALLQKQLSELACPNEIRIGLKYYPVPLTVNEFKSNLCWGQRLMMNTVHTSDFESFLFYFANYYQPIVTKKPHSEKAVMAFYKKIVNCHVEEIYPVLTKLVNHYLELVQIEARKLSSPPDKKLRAAEIDRLKPFNDLSILELVSNKCKVRLDEAHLQPYNVVFALLWYEKEQQEFQKRYNEIIMAGK